MFKRLIGIRSRQSKNALLPAATLETHGAVYCAALNVRRSIESLISAEHADHLYAALANLEDLAKLLASPAADLTEIAQWKEQFRVKAEELRALPDPGLPLPHPQLQIDPAALADQLRRRATA